MQLQFSVTFLCSDHDSAIDDPVGLGVRQALDLRNVKVGVNDIVLESSLGVVRQDASARLQCVVCELTVGFIR